MNKSLEYLRLEIGTNAKILVDDYNIYKSLVLTKSWIQDTWKFLSNHNLQVHISQTAIPRYRDHNIPIMEAINRNQNISDHEKSMCN